MAKAKAAPAAPADTFIGRTTVPLAELTLSPLNSRQVVDQAEVDAMADSIAETGLLQNLVGLQTGTGVEIVGGGKRLRALQLLAAEGWSRPGLAPIDPVPVVLTNNPDRAVAWAGTENTARTALHPADEICAYRALRARGASADMIARTFAVTVAHVTRRLALADLPDAAIAALRANQISLDVAKALTLAPDAVRAEAVLNDAISQGWNDRQTRNALTGTSVSTRDRRVKFVTPEALEAAGAALQHDLFDNEIYIEDLKLLDEMFAEKGLARAEEERIAGGWSWAKFWRGDAWARPEPEGMQRCWPQEVPLPEGDQERLEALEDAVDNGHASEAEMLEYEALQERTERRYSDEDREQGGIWLTVTHAGQVEITAWRPTAASEGRGGDSGGGVTVKTEKPVSEAVLTDLRRIKLLSLQTALLADPHFAVELFAWQLEEDLRAWESPIALAATAPAITPEELTGTIIADGLAAPGPDRSGVDAVSRLRAFLIGDVNAVSALGRRLTRLFQKTEGIADYVADHLEVNPRDVWTPTFAGYFNRLPAPVLDRLFAEFIPADKRDGIGFKALKKGDKAQWLHRLFETPEVGAALGLGEEQQLALTTWLPPQLQWAVPVEAAPDAPKQGEEDQTDEDGDDDLDGDGDGDEDDDEAAK